ncbi:MAG: hypothetical protein OXI01_13845 [Albidovulum sp.]|nr:hypothetical protein [Albidovulum sp.]
MIDARSLFIQHLKLEGKILNDRDRWLERVLQCAEKKRCYKADARESVTLAAPIERFASEVLVKQKLIVADLAYVALRNFGICYLANKGQMIFDYHKVVDGIGGDFCLSKRELKLAHSLRAGKSAYRGLGHGDGVSGTVGELRSVLSKFFVQRPLTEIQYGTPVRDLGSGYAVLRDFEAVIETKIRKEDVARYMALMEWQRVNNWIRDPRSYAWEVRNLLPVDLESLSLKLQVPRNRRSSTSGGHSAWLTSALMSSQIKSTVNRLDMSA